MSETRGIHHKDDSEITSFNIDDTTNTQILQTTDYKNTLSETLSGIIEPTAKDTRLNDTQSEISLNKTSRVSGPNEDQVTEESINKPIKENITVSSTEKEEAFSQSRELKSLLASSKEAKLDTNLSRKRKSLTKRTKSESQSSLGKSPKIQYPVTAESELEMELQYVEGIKNENRDEEIIPHSATPTAAKRMKISLSNASGDSLGDSNNDEFSKKIRKLPTSEGAIFKPDKDRFCWRCHKDSINISCETCPRSYHHRCLKQTIIDPDHWPCPECVLILKAESTQTRSPAMKEMTLEHLCGLLKFAVNRMIQCQGSEPFIHAVNDVEFPDYRKYIIQPMDLTVLEKNIKENLYGSTQAFEADAKWILHNSIIFNSCTFLIFLISHEVCIKKHTQADKYWP